MKSIENNTRQKMMRKIFAIMAKDTNKIVSFSLKAAVAFDEWNDYYVGTEEENTHFLQQTFMSEKEIKVEMGL